MAECSLKPKAKKVRQYSSYQGEITPAPDNLLQRDFHADHPTDHPNEKWLTDITELAAVDGKVYLSPIIDCFDGLVVSWNMGYHPKAELTHGMLKEGISRLKQGQKPVVHTDRGVHYRWNARIEIMSNSGLLRSMSQKACSPDNAACEGFFGRLKGEMYYGRHWEQKSKQPLLHAVNEYLHWDNEKRIKISLGGKSPIEYRKHLGYMT